MHPNASSIGGGAFLWIPGQGYDPRALQRMEHAFPMPDLPMGEAWFMSEERRMYPELRGDLAAIPVERLQRTLVEIANGTASFGAREEWRVWFHYLLPRLVPRSHETFVEPLLEILITALFTQYPAGMEAAPYPGFRDHLLNTLGLCLMDGVCWPDGAQGAEACLDRHYLRPPWTGTRANGALSASMFLCLKYLDAQDVQPWLGSVLAIADPFWRAQVMLWLIGAHEMLTGVVRQPSRFTHNDYPGIDWEWSHCLNGNYSGIHDGEAGRIDFIPEANRLTALETVRAHFTEAACMDWLASFATDTSLEQALAAAPYWFFDLYGVVGT
jgi:hypothetical protein